MLTQAIRWCKIGALPFLIVTMFGLQVASSQVNGDPSCGSHTTGWHKHAGDGYWTSQWKITKWEPEYLIKEIPRGNTTKWVRLVDRVFTNDDCDPADASVVTTKSVQHSVTVSTTGTFGVSYKALGTVLFLELESTTHASVTINAELSDTTNETIEISSSKTVGPCKQVRYVYEKFRRTAAKDFDIADARFECTDASTGKVVSSYCNRGTLVGNGTGWDEVNDGWKFMKMVCACDENGIPTPIPDVVVIDFGEGN